MNTTKIRERQEQLRSTIFRLVTEFQQDTGAQVTSINLDSNSDRFGAPVLDEVTVEIEVGDDDTVDDEETDEDLSDE